MSANRSRHVVLVGGGHTHIHVLEGFAADPPPDCRLTVVVDTPIAVYSGMVPGFVAGHYRREQLEINVLRLARRAEAQVVVARAVGVDPQSRRIVLEDHPPVEYDVASFDIGSTVAGLDLPGIREHALATRPIGVFVQRVAQLVEEAREHTSDEPFRVVVVGAGAGGVELAFTLQHRLAVETGIPLKVSLMDNGPRILSGFAASFVRRVERSCESRGIEILCDRRVAAADAESLRLATGESTPYHALIWVAGPASQPIFAEAGLATDRRGFVHVRSTLQVVGHDDLFAVGDCATLIDHPNTPKAGVYAVRQGPFVTDNLRAWLAGTSLRTYKPQSDFLMLLNLGDGTAVGSKWGRSFQGRWVMRLKDWIDRRFMRRFQLPEPEGKSLSS